MSMDKQNNQNSQGIFLFKDHSADRDSNLELLNMIPSNDSSQVGGFQTLASKLKAQNQHLEMELQNLKTQLQQVLEKKQSIRKGNSSPGLNSVVTSKDGSIPGEKTETLQRELASIHKEIDNYRKEIKTLHVKYGNSPIGKLDQTNNKLYEKQVELKCLEMERKTLEKSLKDKNKLLKEIQELNEKVTLSKEPSSATIEEELKTIKSKVKEAQKREQILEKEAQKSNQHVLKLLDELSLYKENYRKLLTKTGYDPVEDKIKPIRVIANSPAKSQAQTARSHLNSLVRNTEETDVIKLEPTPANFEKLKEEYKEHKKAEMQKQRIFKLKTTKFKENLQQLEKEKEDILMKATEKEKEATILKNRTRELYRVLLSNGLLPPGKDYESLFKEKQTSQGLIEKKRKNQARSLSVGLRKRSNDVKDLKNVSDMKKAEKLKEIEDMLEELERKQEIEEKQFNEDFLQNGFKEEEVPTTIVSKGIVVKGYRVDEIGRKMEKDNREEFNDQEKIGDTIVRIIIVRVWYDDDCITGLQAIYRTETGQLIEGPEHVKEKTKYKVAELNLKESDYLKDVGGVINQEENVIECLKLVSYKGASIVVGKAKKGSKQFKFDINDLEFPAIFKGAVRNKTKDKGSVLCKLGVYIRSEAIEEDIGNHNGIGVPRKLSRSMNRSQPNIHQQIRNF